MHETAHGFNSFVLDWDKTNISWFDEGVATYISSFMYRVLNKTRPEIFGGDIRWRDNYTIYTLKSEFKPEDLYNYYRHNNSWMLYWYPSKYNDYKRNFGYAYSELFIREYLYENSSALHRVYKELLKINKSIKSPEERNKIMLNILEKDFKPCYSLNLSKIKNCTKKLNYMVFEIPSGEKINYNYRVEPIKIEFEEKYSSYEIFYNFLKDIVEKIISYIYSFANF